MKGWHAMENNKLSEMMQSTMNNIKNLVEVNNIVGEPIVTPDGQTIIPVSKLSFGFGGAGGDSLGGSKQGYGGGSAAALIAPAANPRFILAALFLALGASVAGYSLFNYAVSHAPMANVAVFHNLATIVSVAAGIFILGEKLTAVSLGAMVVVLIGIWGVQKYPPENEFEED